MIVFWEHILNKKPKIPEYVRTTLESVCDNTRKRTSNITLNTYSRINFDEPYDAKVCNSFSLLLLVDSDMRDKLAPGSDRVVYDCSSFVYLEQTAIYYLDTPIHYIPDHVLKDP
jgi:hypothetical protein